MGKNRTNISIVDRAGIRRKAEIVIGKKGSNSSGTIFDANAVEEMLNKKLENYTIIKSGSLSDITPGKKEGEMYFCTDLVAGNNIYGVMLYWTGYRWIDAEGNTKYGPEGIPAQGGAPYPDMVPQVVTPPSGGGGAA